MNFWRIYSFHDDELTNIPGCLCSGWRQIWRNWQLDKLIDTFGHIPWPFKDVQKFILVVLNICEIQYLCFRHQLQIAIFYFICQNCHPVEHVLLQLFTLLKRILSSFTLKICAESIFIFFKLILFSLFLLHLCFSLLFDTLLSQSGDKIFIVQVDAEELDKTAMANHIDSSQTFLKSLINFLLVSLLITYFSYNALEHIIIIEKVLL